MSTFKEASLARNALKIPLSHFAWTKGLAIESDEEGFCVVVYVTKLDNTVRKHIPVIHDGVSVKTVVDH